MPSCSLEALGVQLYELVSSDYSDHREKPAALLCLFLTEEMASVHVMSSAGLRFVGCRYLTAAKHRVLVEAFSLLAMSDR